MGQKEELRDQWKNFEAELAKHNVFVLHVWEEPVKVPGGHTFDLYRIAGGEKAAALIPVLHYKDGGFDLFQMSHIMTLDALITEFVG